METLVIIDGDFIPYTACYNKKDATPKTLEEVLQECNRIVWDILVKTKATKYIGYLGVKGKSTFRHEINSNYKAHRPTESMMYMRECRKHLIDFWKFHYTPEKLEADDCVNITRKALGGIIVSPDQDLLNLEGRHYNPKTQDWVDRAFQHEVALYLFWLDMLQGQKGDNILGINGWGIKTAIRYLAACPSAETLAEQNLNYAAHVLKAYISYYKSTGVEMFYKTYTCLKILDEYPGFTPPEPNLVDLEMLIQIQVRDDQGMETW